MRVRAPERRHNGRMLAARACALLLVLGGCLARGYRYVDVPGSTDTVRGHLEQRARADGMLVYHERGATLLKADPPARESLPPAVTTPDQAPLRSRYRYEIIPRLVAVARFHSLAPERTRIELSGNLERAKVIVPDPPGVVVTPVDTFGWSEWLGLGIDVAVGAGVVSDPEYHASGRLDGTLRFSRRLYRFGEVDSATRTRWSLIASSGIGVRLSPQGFAFRPELLVSFSRNRAAWLVPWWQLPMGPRTLFDLSFAGLLEERGRRGFEAGVSVRRPPWVGLYARAGVFRGSGDLRGGPIFSAGLESGTIPSIGLAAVGIVVGALVAAAGGALGDALVN